MESNMTKFLHFDLDKFYASCIRAFMPHLNNVPVVVLSNNDGCAICISKEAARFGVKMGTKMFEHPWKGIAEREGIVQFSTNFPLFASMSLRVKKVISKHFGTHEDYSIDEIFTLEDDMPYEVAREKALAVVDEVMAGLHMPISCGIAPTKTLAKVATRFAKKFPAYNRVCVIGNDFQRQVALQRTEIGDVWGIGRAHTKRLKAIGIHNAYDFVHGNAITPAWVQKYMTKIGMKTFLEMKGESRIDIEYEQPAKKNIMVSRSFGKNIRDLESLESAMTYYVQLNAKKLRAQGTKASKISVFIATNPFRDDHEQDYPWVTIPLPVATSSNLEIGEYARLAVRAMYRPGLWYKKAGIMTGEMCPANQVQGHLYDSRDRAKEDRLMVAWDYIRGRYGPESIWTGIQKPSSYDWWVKQEKLSPCWTTREKDFPRCEDWPALVPPGTPPRPVWATGNGFGAFSTKTVQKSVAA